MQRIRDSRHGSANQEPLGTIDCPHSSSLYDWTPTTHSPRPEHILTCHGSPVQVGSAIEGFIWPKLLWDFLTKNLNGAVKPVPILQILNLILGLVGLAWEWPLNLIAGTFPHRSIEIRLAIYPLSAMAAILLYQGTHPALYYLVGMGVYFWAYTEGEVSTVSRPRRSFDKLRCLSNCVQIVCAEPWTLPKRRIVRVEEPSLEAMYF